MINLTQYWETEGKKETLTIPFPFEEVSYYEETYPVAKKEEISLTFENVGKGKLRLLGEGQFELQLPCDRCLEDVPTTIAFSIERELYSPEVELTEEQQDFQTCVEGYELDEEALLSEEIQMNWPQKILCKEDCKGICKSCGQNLNKGTCDCDTFVPDPRMMQFQDIFNSIK